MGDPRHEPEPVSLPPDVVLVRRTPTFTESTVPSGLLATHRIGAGVWGRLVVQSGRVRFAFEDDPDVPHEPRQVHAGEQVVIPPGRPHHLELDGPATFAVEFHRIPLSDDGAAGDERPR